MEYEVIEWGYLTNQRIQELHHGSGLTYLRDSARDGLPGPWTLKGSEFLWLRKLLGQLEAKRTLDIGPQSSSVPQIIATEFGCDAWAIDKFGEKRAYAQERLNELARRQGGDPRELHPDVTYVNGFMGEKMSELPEQYFDLVYSLSTLEHIDYSFMPSVFADIDRVLKPGGYMAHCIDLSLPLGVSANFAEKLAGKSERVAQIRSLPGGNWILSLLRASADGRLPPLPLVVGQWIYHSLMTFNSGASKPYLMTASGWSKFLRRTFTLKQRQKMRGTGVVASLLSQDPYRETPGIRYETWPVENEIKPYWPMTTLMIVLRKEHRGSPSQAI